MLVINVNSRLVDCQVLSSTRNSYIWGSDIHVRNVIMKLNLNINFENTMILNI